MNFQKKNNKNLCEFNLPAGFKHLAIIMDGNGRWAQEKGWPRHFGHFRGVKALRHIIQTCSDNNVPYLTVFAFSTENWKRSSIEISVIMKLMSRSLLRYRKMMEQNQIRLHIIGNIQPLNPSIQHLCEDIMKSTKVNKGLQLIIAINYGGRSEIVQAIQQIAEKIQSNELHPKDLNESVVSQFIASSRFPPPDLIIRTGAVSRLSNFYLWNAAYSELYISPVLWPDFNELELQQAFNFYNQTKRRFGAIPTTNT